MVNGADIRQGYRTDHSLITLTLKCSDIVFGRSYWKFNNSLLKNMDFINMVKNTISETISTYSKHENWKGSPLLDIDLTIDDNLFLEVLMMKMRGCIISFSSYNKKRKCQEEKKLVEDIEKLERNCAPEEINILLQKKSDLQSLRKERLQGAIIRSKSKIIETVEKPTSLFLSLEKKNSVAKHIRQLYNEDERIVCKHESILERVSSFYENLFKEDKDLKKIDLENFFEDDVISRLENDQCLFLERPLTLTELTQSLRKLSNNKSPGMDGFTVEFIKFF